MTAPALRARGLIKQFGSLVAVSDVNLELAPGEVRGLLGPNGAGKTTLLRMLFGLVAPDGGSVELFGDPLVAGRDGTAARMAGFVERPGFYPYLSGRANLSVFGELDGGHPPERLESVLEKVGLAGRASDRASTYSTGMLQRLGIAAALLRSPSVLLLDEPTSGLDPAGARDVARLLRDLSSTGVAILVSSHQVGELEELCDSFTFLREGRVVWNGTASRLRAEAPASAFRLGTSDDERALEIAESRSDVSATLRFEGGIELEAGQDGLDEFVQAVVQSGIRLRRLELLRSPLLTMFFALTEPQDVTVEAPTEPPAYVRLRQP